MTARRALWAGLVVSVHACATGPAAAPPPKPLPGLIPYVPGEPIEMFTMRYQEVKVGTGTAATPRRCYYAHYTGWLMADGKKFQSSYDTNASGQVNTPFAFAQGARQVIAGWDVGFAGMRVGGKRRLLIPQQLAYGETGRGNIPPKSDLVFDVDLLGLADTLATADSASVRRNPRTGALPNKPWCAPWDSLPPGAKQ